MLEGILGAVGQITQAGASAQQGQDAITQALIASSTAKKSNATIYIALGILFVVFAFIGLVVYLKYKK